MVTTPAGDMWRVRRLWAPRLGGESLWARLRRRTRIGRRFIREVGEAGDPGCAIDALEDLFLVFAIVVVVVILSLVGIPLLLAVLDLVVLILLTVLGVGARLLFRRPWVVEARSTARSPVDAGGAGPSDAPPVAARRHTWRIVGWRASGAAVEAVANALAHGNPLPPGDIVAAPAVPPQDRTA